MASNGRTFLVDNDDLLIYVRELREIGISVDLKHFAGTVAVTDADGVVALRAIRKGKPGQPWISTFRNSINVKWSHDEQIEEVK